MSDKKLKHFSMADIARHMAQGETGYKAESMEKAAAMLRQNNLQDVGCLLELVRRLDVIFQAIGRDVNSSQLLPPTNDDRPEYSVPFPQVKVGDCVYEVDDEGLARNVVLAKDQDHHIRIAPLQGQETRFGRYPISWGSERTYVTVTAALEQWIVTEEAYHEPRLARAKRAKLAAAAFAAGEDLAQFAEFFENS